MFMEAYSIPRRIWRIIYPPLIYAAVGYAVIFAFILTFAFYIGVWDVLGGNIGFKPVFATVEEIISFVESNALWFQLAACVACMAVFLPMWLGMRKKITQYSGNRMSPSVVLLVCGAGTGAYFLIVLIIGALDLLRFFPSYEALEDVLYSSGFVVRFLVMGMAAPVAEELCFRGIVLNRLLGWLPKWAAVLICSVLFGLIHLNPLQSIYAAMAGVAFSLLYVRFRNLGLCIIGHMAFNLLSVILAEFSGGEGIAGWALLILFALALGVVCVRGLVRRPAAVPKITEEPFSAESTPGLPD